MRRALRNSQASRSGSDGSTIQSLQVFLQPRLDFLEALCHSTSFSIGVDKRGPASSPCQLAVRAGWGRGLGAFRLHQLVPSGTRGAAAGTPGVRPTAARLPSPPDCHFRVLLSLGGSLMSEEARGSSGKMGSEEKPVS